VTIGITVLHYASQLPFARCSFKYLSGANVPAQWLVCTVVSVISPIRKAWISLELGEARLLL